MELLKTPILLKSTTTVNQYFKLQSFTFVVKDNFFINKECILKLH
jgi:hypothetical protein